MANQPVVCKALKTWKLKRRSLVTDIFSVFRKCEIRSSRDSSHYLVFKQCRLCNHKLVTWQQICTVCASLYQAFQLSRAISETSIVRNILYTPHPPPPRRAVNKVWSREAPLQTLTLLCSMFDRKITTSNTFHIKWYTFHIPTAGILHPFSL